MMHCVTERALEEQRILEASCDGIRIRTGRIGHGEVREHRNSQHQIAAPCAHATGLLSYRGEGGDARQTRVSDRHICVIPAGHLHTTAWRPEAHLTTIMVEPTFLGSMAQRNDLHGYQMTARYGSVDPFLWQLVRSIEHQLRHRRILETSYVESVAVVIGQHLLCHYTDAPARAATSGGLPRYKMRRAIDYVRTHFQEEIGFRDIADQLDMSPFHFARMFKQSTGESPHQFIMRCRIEAAKTLLMESERSIADIALDVGYKSQSYFTTRFALLVGMTPAAFRGAH